jgi:hypothetical protein
MIFFRQNYYAAKWGTNYLTQREIDLDIINRCESKPRLIARPLPPTLLSHALPVVDDVEITKILQLRKAESAAFDVYRDALTRALKQNKNLTLAKPTI